MNTAHDVQLTDYGWEMNEHEHAMAGTIETRGRHQVQRYVESNCKLPAVDAIKHSVECINYY